MEYPWEVVGYELVKNEEKNKTSIRLYVQRDLTGADGEGVETGRLFYNPEYCKYEPELGHKIIAIDGRYGIDRIIRVG